MRKSVFFAMFIVIVTIVCAVMLSLFTVGISAESFEISPGSDRVIFIADGAEGDGSSASSPLKADPNPTGFSASAQYPKHHLHTAFYQATEALKDTGGTIVVCGEVLLGINESYGSGSSTRDVFTATFNKPIKITSVYNGVDYRETNGARIVLEYPAEIGMNGESIWENIDIVTSGPERVISCNGYRTVFGEGINCRPLDPSKAGDPIQYVSISAGHRYSAVESKDFHVIVRSGTYYAIAGGVWGVLTNTSLRNVNVNITLEGTTTVLDRVVGTSFKKTPFGGYVNITINGGKYNGYIYGGGTTAFINSNAEVRLEISGGDFSGIESIAPLDPEAEAGYVPKTAVLDVSSFKEEDRETLIDLLKKKSGFASNNIDFPEWLKAELPGDENGFLYGDANEDGTVSAPDMVRLKRYFAEYDAAAGTSSVSIGKGADADGDGKVSALDIIRLKLYFASYNETTKYSPVILGPAWNAGENYIPSVDDYVFDPSKYTFVQKFPAPTGDRREIVKNYMMSMYDFEWTPAETFTVGWKNTGDFGVNLKYTAGTKYKGMVYSQTCGTLDLFEQYLNNGKFKDRTYYYEEVVGNHCSASMVMAYEQLIDLPMNGSLKPAPVRKGLLMFPIDETGKEVLVNPTDRGYTTWYSSTVFELSGKENVYKAYSLLDTGDILYKNIPATGHTRMVDYVVTMKDAEGNIDPAKSYVYTIEQTNAFDKTRKDGVNTTWWIDHAYSFSNLYSTNFMPVTLCAYHNNEPLRDAWILYNGNNTAANASKILYGEVKSNFPLNYVRLTLSDSTGKVVSESKMYLDVSTNRACYSVKLNDYRAKLFEGVPSGTYTFNVRAGIARGGCDVETFEITIP